jgi:hypothetical protein
VHTGFWSGNLIEGGLLEEPGVDGDNIKMDLREVEWGHGRNRSDSGQGQLAGCCEYGNERSGFMKCGKFLEKLGTC